MHFSEKVLKDQEFVKFPLLYIMISYEGLDGPSCMRSIVWQSFVQ